MRALRAWATRTLVRELPYHDKSLDNATIEVVKILVAYRCTMEWAWLRIHRALTTLDMSLIYLYPEVNYTRMLQRYFRNAERRRLAAILSAEMVRRTDRRHTPLRSTSRTASTSTRCFKARWCGATRRCSAAPPSKVDGGLASR